MLPTKARRKLAKEKLQKALNMTDSTIDNGAYKAVDAFFSMWSGSDALAL